MKIRNVQADFVDGRGSDYITRNRAMLQTLAATTIMLIVGILLGSAVWPVAALAGPVKVVPPMCEVKVSRIGTTNTITVLVHGKPTRVAATISGTYRPKGILKSTKSFNLGRVQTPYVTPGLGVIWVARGTLGSGKRCVAYDGMY